MEKLLKQVNGTLFEVPTMIIPEPTALGQILMVQKDTNDNFILVFATPIFNLSGQQLLTPSGEFLIL